MQVAASWCPQRYALRGVLFSRPIVRRLKIATTRLERCRSRRTPCPVQCQLENRETVLSPQPLPKQSPLREPESEEEAEVEEEEAPPPPGFLSWLMEHCFKAATAVIRGAAWLTSRPVVRLILFVLTLYGGYAFLAAQRRYTMNVLYSEFVKQVEAGRVESVYFESKSNKIRFLYDASMWNGLREKLQERRPSMTPREMQRRIDRIDTVSKVVPGQTDSLTQLLKKKKVTYGVVEPSLRTVLATFLSMMAWIWLPFLPLVYVMMRVLDTRFGGKQRKGRRYASPSVRFGDVAAMDSAKVELLEVVELLKDPNKYAKLNAKGPSGVLMYGPTGTGKTLLARAVAGEAGVPFYAVSGSEFVEMFVGRGAARIRDLFREARKNKPCVVFIDEIDAVGGIRGGSFNDERDQTLNQLLVELDGFEDSASVILLAATNRFSSLDPALLRPGRLTRKIRIPLPDALGRADILAVHLRDVPMESHETKIAACEFVARFTPGFSGADLANTVNEAALMAARENRDFVVVGDLMTGLQRTKQPVNKLTTPPKWLAPFQQSVLDKMWNESRTG